MIKTEQRVPLRQPDQGSVSRNGPRIRLAPSGVLLHEVRDVIDCQGRLGKKLRHLAVSYTHLTLPTSDLV